MFPEFQTKFISQCKPIFSYCFYIWICLQYLFLLLREVRQFKLRGGVDIDGRRIDEGQVVASASGEGCGVDRGGVTAVDDSSQQVDPAAGDHCLRVGDSTR